MPTATPIPFLDVRAITEFAPDDLDLCWRNVLSHGRFIGGPEVETFEERFAEYCGAALCVGVGNGTDALELIFAGLGIGPGDEVIVRANTFVATVEAVCAVGARPRFVDVEPGTLEIDPDAVAAAIGPRTAAVVAVHLFGQMVDLDRLTPLVQRHGLALIEDAAQAHGPASTVVGPAVSASPPPSVSTQARTWERWVTAAPWCRTMPPWWPASDNWRTTGATETVITSTGCVAETAGWTPCRQCC
jgi:hypothetical protein